MPIINSFSSTSDAQINELSKVFGSSMPSNGLLLEGPIIQVEISPPQILINDYAARNLPIPQPIVGSALIDTGATRTAIDKTIATQLRLNPINVITSHTPSGAVDFNQYAINLKFPALGFSPGLEFAEVAGLNIIDQGIIALIGRDILAQGLLVYNGAIGLFTFVLA